MASREVVVSPADLVESAANTFTEFEVQLSLSFTAEELKRGVRLIGCEYASNTLQTAASGANVALTHCVQVTRVSKAAERPINDSDVLWRTFYAMTAGANAAVLAILEKYVFPGKSHESGEIRLDRSPWINNQSAVQSVFAGIVSTGKAAACSAQLILTFQIRDSNVPL
jgi:hypothetical protein